MTFLYFFQCTFNMKKYVCLNVPHIGCMVEMLSKAGCLEELVNRFRLGAVVRNIVFFVVIALGSACSKKHSLSHGDLVMCAGLASVVKKNIEQVYPEGIEERERLIREVSLITDNVLKNSEKAFIRREPEKLEAFREEVAHYVVAAERDIYTSESYWNQYELKLLEYCSLLE